MFFRLMQRLKRYGISGVLSYGLLNTVYYLSTFLLVWWVDNDTTLSVRKKVMRSNSWCKSIWNLKLTICNFLFDKYLIYSLCSVELLSFTLHVSVALICRIPDTCPALHTHIGRILYSILHWCLWQTVSAYLAVPNPLFHIAISFLIFQHKKCQKG